jgi:nitrogen fixation-related uncharacterized protein
MDARARRQLQSGEPTRSDGWFFFGPGVNLNQKVVNTAKTRALLRGPALAFKTDSLELENLLRKVAILKEALQYDEAVAQMSASTWALKQKQYDAKEISSEAFLTEKRAFIQREAALAEKRKELALAVLRVGKWCV